MTVLQMLEQWVKEGSFSFGLNDAEVVALAAPDSSVSASLPDRCSVCCGEAADNDCLVICGRCGVHVHVSEPDSTASCPSLGPSCQLILQALLAPLSAVVCCHHESSNTATASRRYVSTIYPTLACLACVSSSAFISSLSLPSLPSDVIAEGDWLCEPCTLRVKGDALRCVLCCSLEDRAYKQTSGSTPDGCHSVYHPTALTPRTRWVHVSCAHHHPETRFSEGDNEWRSPVLGLTQVNKERFELLRCMFCRSEQSRTACLQCSYGRCRHAYCVPCGMRRGVKFETRRQLDDDGEDTLPPQQLSFCPTHRQYSAQVTKRNAVPKTKKRHLRQSRHPLRLRCPVCRTPAVLKPSQRDLGVQRRYDLSIAVRIFRVESGDPLLPREEESDEEPLPVVDTPKKPPSTKTLPVMPFETIAKTKGRRLTAGAHQRGATSPTPPSPLEAALPPPSPPPPCEPLPRLRSPVPTQRTKTPTKPTKPKTPQVAVEADDDADSNDADSCSPTFSPLLGPGPDRSDAGDGYSGSLLVEMTVEEAQASVDARRFALQQPFYHHLLHSLVTDARRWTVEELTAQLSRDQMLALCRLHGYKERASGQPRAGSCYRARLKEDLAAVLLQWRKEGRLREGPELWLTLPPTASEGKKEAEHSARNGYGYDLPAKRIDRVTDAKSDEEKGGDAAYEAQAKASEGAEQQHSARRPASRGAKPGLRKKKRKRLFQLEKKTKRAKAPSHHPPSMPTQKRRGESKEAAMEEELREDSADDVEELEDAPEWSKEGEGQKVPLPPARAAVAPRPSSATTAPATSTSSPKAPLPLLPRLEIPVSSDDDEDEGDDVAMTQSASLLHRSSVASSSPSLLASPPSPLPPILLLSPLPPSSYASVGRRLVRHSDAAVSAFSQALQQLTSSHEQAMLQRCANGGASASSTATLSRLRRMQEFAALHQQLHLVEQAMVLEATAPITEEMDRKDAGGSGRQQRAKVSIKQETR